MCLALFLSASALAGVNCSRSQRRIAVNACLEMAADFSRFGPNVIPDTQLFRIRGDRIRYVHRLTFRPGSGREFD